MLVLVFAVLLINILGHNIYIRYRLNQLKDKYKISTNKELEDELFYGTLTSKTCGTSKYLTVSSNKEGSIKITENTKGLTKEVPDSIEYAPLEYKKLRTRLQLKGYDTVREDEIMTIAQNIAKVESLRQQTTSTTYRNEDMIVLKLTEDLYKHMLDLDKVVEKDPFQQNNTQNSLLDKLLQQIKEAY